MEEGQSAHLIKCVKKMRPQPPNVNIHGSTLGKFFPGVPCPMIQSMLLQPSCALLLAAVSANI